MVSLFLLIIFRLLTPHVVTPKNRRIRRIKGIYYIILSRCRKAFPHMRASDPKVLSWPLVSVFVCGRIKPRMLAIADTVDENLPMETWLIQVTHLSITSQSKHVEAFKKARASKSNCTFFLSKRLRNSAPSYVVHQLRDSLVRCYADTGIGKSEFDFDALAVLKSSTCFACDVIDVLLELIKPPLMI